MQAQMLLRLGHARARFDHRGEKGDVVEDAVRDFLRQYLPRNLAVGKGEIVDSYGDRTAQTDVVIASDDHPFTFTEDRPGLFFVDGIVAAAEVKTVLTTDELEKIIKNSGRYKNLRVNAPDGTQAHSNPSDLARWYEKPPPWFVIALESRVPLETIVARLNDAVPASTPTGYVDAIFCLDRGWAINFGDGKGAFAFKKTDSEDAQGWVWKKSPVVLADLMLWLSVVMPRPVRFQSILPRYMM